MSLDWAGKIFVSCDQVQAEDWIVQAIISDVSGNTKGLDELRGGTDRHRRLATQLFKKHWDECGKDTMFRFFGKKTRHACNYDMGPGEMAIQLVKEGFSLSKEYCDTMIRSFHAYEPEIKNSFHNTIKKLIETERTLATPIGRTRYFFGLRPGANNNKIFKEAYSYIPQSTIGDNTGLAILVCEREGVGQVVMDTNNDAITLEVDDTAESVSKAIKLLQKSFDREIVFPRTGA